jgi:hypothetical protein
MRLRYFIFFVNYLLDSKPKKHLIQELFMSQFNVIDRSLVGIFDIEGFSQGTQQEQANLVTKFFAVLSNYLEKHNKMKPDSVSTGDGSIVSVGRQCSITLEETKSFLQFAIDFTKEMCQSGINIRAALNYSERERIVSGFEHALKGQSFQVGNAKNMASRIISFCEPRELMISQSVYELLRDYDLEKQFHFNKNDVLETKHGVLLHTFTYVPSYDENILYSPKSPLHKYKRFSSFPPIKAETLDYFVSSGLEAELHTIISKAYDTIGCINNTKTFISTSEVIDILTRPYYDPEDKVYVVSRSDRKTHFWTQKNRNQYLTFLTNNANRNGGYINQERIMVFEDLYDNTHAPEEDINYSIEALHAPETYFTFPEYHLKPYEKISELIFGVTISTKYKYAIISIPSHNSKPKYLKPENFGDLLSRYRDYEIADGPMKAIITADKKYVENLIEEFEKMKKNPNCKCAQS